MKVLLFTVTLLSLTYILPKFLEKILSKFLSFDSTLNNQAIQAKISLLKGDIYYTPVDIVSIKNAIQRGIGQLSTTSHSRVMKDFLESIMLFFEKNKYTNIRRF